MSTQDQSMEEFMNELLAEEPTPVMTEEEENAALDAIIDEYARPTLLETTEFRQHTINVLNSAQPYLAHELVNHPKIPAFERNMILYVYCPSLIDPVIVNAMLVTAQGDDEWFTQMCKHIANPIDLVTLVTGVSCLRIFRLTRNKCFINLIKQYIVLPDFDKYSRIVRCC